MVTRPAYQKNKQVLAAIDLSHYAISVADCAAWAASQLKAPLQLLNIADRSVKDSLHELRGGMSEKALQLLLDELMSQDESNPKPLGKQHGRALLQALFERVVAGYGIQPQIQQCQGKLIDILMDAQDETGLCVLGKRGETADYSKGNLGSNLEAAIRGLQCPVLVASRNFKPVRRFLIAFDGSPSTRKCIELVCSNTLVKGAECDLLMVADTPSNEQQLDLEWAKQRLQMGGFRANAWVASGSPEVAIAQQIEANRVDLLAMGAYGHSRLRTMFAGSTTSRILRTCLVPVLVVR
ncbi:MAG: universal stress protein [Xanthomonadaceae bacterium]|nr:universal stress protein [Xanthomonadaceae bacterium]